MRFNTKSNKTNKNTTHEGAPVRDTNPEQKLRRSVMSCLLWEDTFYEGGMSIHDRIVQLAEQVPPTTVAQIAIEARTKQKLRHVPLLLLTVLAKTASGTNLLSETIPQVINRADELAELVALYWRNGKVPLSAQMKRGIAAAFHKFDEYALAKYDRAGAVKLRDVLFLTHAKPESPEQQAMWQRLIDGTMATPDTWETRLSGGADKGESFDTLLREGKLGYMALLRNLRNMVESNVDRDLVSKAIRDRKGASKAFPFRFMSALKAAPSYAGPLDEAFKMAVANQEPMDGTTVIMIDVSGSMDASVSAKSTVTRAEAGAALAAIIPCAEKRVILFGTDFAEVPAFDGLAGVMSINTRGHALGWGTNMGKAMNYVNRSIKHDRVIIVSDGQSHDPLPNPRSGVKGYMINTAPYEHGVGYGPWTVINGWSEASIDFMREIERFEIED